MNAQAAFKERNPMLVRERDRDYRAGVRSEERDEKGLAPRFLPGHLAKRLYRIWTAEDVERWYAYAKSREARVVMQYPMLEKLSKMDLVPNEPFRLAWGALSRDVKAKTFREVVREYGPIDERQFLHALGRGVAGTPPRIRIFLEYELAAACCKAMGMHPAEAGI